MSATESLLIEIGCEDLPARYVVPLAEALAQGIAAGLAKRGLPATGAQNFATPRRLAARFDAVPPLQAAQQIERKGPQLSAAYKDGAPTPAALGFARSCGVAFEELAQDAGYLVFRKQQPGRATAELLPEIFEETLKAMDELVPKRMRWGSGSETFVRPVQWLLALLGSEVVPLRRFGLDAGRITYGHRFHAPEAITLAGPDEYASKLQGAKVWADFGSRRDEIESQIKAEAAKLGGTPKIDAALLDEVTALVEWPVVISGRIEDRFLELPPEVIVATVETNQRYFTVFDAGNKLKPAFITIANIESKDVAQVIAGNERVVRPRLSDALFFWQQDLKLDFKDYAYVLKLQDVTYQKLLGSLWDKVRRIESLTEKLVVATGEKTGYENEPVPFGSAMYAAQVARLSKNDLVTRMVYEFPELQGVIGGHYARRAKFLGSDPERDRENVAIAVTEHYLPTHAGGPIPSTTAGRIVALADKLDTLAGIFANGQKPTASKDPYALRRAALGVLRIIIEGRFALDIRTQLNNALQAQPAGQRDAAKLDELVNFVMERLRAYRVGTELDGRAITAEMFEAVAALGISQPLDFDARLRAIHAFWALPAAQSLAAAHKRVRNILRQAGGAAGGPVAPSLFAHAAETALHEALLALPAGGDYGARLAALATLREPVDAFFDMRTPGGEPLMVNDPDAGVRANRLALLAALDARCREVADLSCLPG